MKGYNAKHRPSSSIVIGKINELGWNMTNSVIDKIPEFTIFDTHIKVNNISVMKLKETEVFLNRLIGPEAGLVEELFKDMNEQNRKWVRGNTESFIKSAFFVPGKKETQAKPEALAEGGGSNAADKKIGNNKHVKEKSSVDYAREISERLVPDKTNEDKFRLYVGDLRALADTMCDKVRKLGPAGDAVGAIKFRKFSEFVVNISKSALEQGHISEKKIDRLLNVLAGAEYTSQDKRLIFQANTAGANMMSTEMVTKVIEPRFEGEGKIFIYEAAHENVRSVNEGYSSEELADMYPIKGKIFDNADVGVIKAAVRKALGKKMVAEVAMVPSM